MKKRQENVTKSFEQKTAQLAHIVFSTDDGIALLDALSIMYERIPLVDDNANMVYYRIGQRDLIRELKNWIKDDLSVMPSGVIPHDDVYED